MKASRRASALAILAFAFCGAANAQTLGILATQPGSATHSISTAIAKTIVEHRIKHNLNQTELAKMVKVSQQQISYIEEGDFSNFQTIQKVLLAIGFKITRIQIGQLSAKEKKIVKNHLQQV